MLATAVDYFIAASFGEKVEARNHEAKAAETGQENLEVIPHHEATQNIHVGGSRPLQASNNGSTVEEATERGIGFAENNVVVGNNENAKRSVELPFFLTAAIAYILVGFWMLKA